MNCESVVRLLKRGAENLPPNAAEHMRECPNCRVTALYSEPEPQLSPELHHRIALSLDRDMTAVAPFRRGRHLLLLAALVALVIAAGVAVLGTRGWRFNGALAKVLLTLTIGTGLIGGLSLLIKLTVPGTLLRVRPGVLAAGVFIALVGEAALYPLATYAHFARAAAACFTIGLVHAIPVMLGILWVLRRGFVVSPVAAAVAAGQVSGLAGLAVLFIFCPHLDAGHYLLAHIGMATTCTVLAPVVAMVRGR